MMYHKLRSTVVIEELRKEISIKNSAIPIVQEDILQVDDISLPSRSGKIVDSSADNEPKSDLELAYHVVIDTQSQRVSRRSGRVIQ